MPPKRTTQTKFPNDELSEEMYKKQMEKRIVSLQDDLDKEQKERNKFQIERDRMQTFWEITKREVEENKYELSVKQREMEEAEERHQQEMKVYKQKVRNLLYENQNSLSELKSEGAVSSKVLQTKHAEKHNDLRRLKDELKEHQQSTEKLIKNFQLKHVVEKTELINDFARQTQEIESKYKQKYKELHQWEELRHKTEIQEFKELKNMHLNTLIKNHEKALKEMRDFYDIIQKNLDLITSLQEELKETKMRETQARKEMVKLLQENNKLMESQQGDQVTAPETMKT